MHFHFVSSSWAERGKSYDVWFIDSLCCFCEIEGEAIFRGVGSNSFSNDFMTRAYDYATNVFYAVCCYWNMWAFSHLKASISIECRGRKAICHLHEEPTRSGIVSVEFLSFSFSLSMFIDHKISSNAYIEIKTPASCSFELLCSSFGIYNWNMFHVACFLVLMQNDKRSFWRLTCRLWIVAGESFVH